MSAEEQLAYERRVRNRHAVVAALAGVLLIAASMIQLSGAHTTVDELTLDLLTANRRFPLDLIGAVVNGLASLAIAWTLLFLYRCARARNPEIRGFIRILTMVGGGLAALTGIVYGIVVAIKVHTFASTGTQTYDEAAHLTSGAGLLVLQLLGQLAALLVAVSFVLVCMQAMRVGLLTKFLGYLGMFAGALVLFQITQVPVVQLFWLVSVGYLISGRWPSGVPAAWQTGEAEVLPSGAQMRAQRAAGASAPAPRGARAGASPRGGTRAGGGGARAGGGGGARAGGGLAGWLAGRVRPASSADAANGASASAAAQPTPTTPTPRTRAGTPKRKRKRRN